MTRINEITAVNEAKKILEKAKELKLTLRLFGGVGILIRCQNQPIPELLKREYVDLDFVGLSKDVCKITDFFENIGYSPLKRFNTVMGSERLLFVSEGPIDHIDIILDKLRMCHNIDLRSRLLIESETIPLVDLLLSKMQVVNITEKDLNDITMLLITHDIGETEQNKINIDYLSKLLAHDWGFWKTISLNLEFLENHLLDKDLPENIKKDAISKICKIKNKINSTNKSIRWKLRSIIGTKIKWYELPEEVHQ